MRWRSVRFVTGLSPRSRASEETEKWKWERACAGGKWEGGEVGRRREESIVGQNIEVVHNIVDRSSHAVQTGPVMLKKEVVMAPASTHMAIYDACLPRITPVVVGVESDIACK